MKTETEFKIDQLRQDIILKRCATNRLGMRVCADEIGISPATLSRIERGKLPDILTFAKLCKWLCANPNKYF